MADQMRPIETKSLNRHSLHAVVRAKATNTNMITAARQPINRQTAAQLSKGVVRVSTVEEALERVWACCSNEQGKKRVREALESGKEVCEYRIKIYKRPSGAPGFAVRMYYVERDHEINPAHFTDLL